MLFSSFSRCRRQKILEDPLGFLILILVTTANILVITMTATLFTLLIAVHFAEPTPPDWNGARKPPLKVVGILTRIGALFLRFDIHVLRSGLYFPVLRINVRRQPICRRGFSFCGIATVANPLIHPVPASRVLPAFSGFAPNPLTICIAHPVSGHRQLSTGW